MKALAGLAVAFGFLVISVGANADHISKNFHLSYPDRADWAFAVANPSANPRKLENAPADRKPAEIVERAKWFLDNTETFSLILLEKERIVFEGYANGSSPNQRMWGASMSKSLVALAVGEALCSGKLKSLDDAAGNYATDVSGTAYGKSSVRNLLKMTSGAYDDVISTGLPTPTIGTELAAGKRSLLESLRAYGAQATSFGREVKQGEKWVYKGFDTEAAALVVEGATGMPFHKWFEHSVWAKVGGEAKSSWSLTRDGRAYASGTFAATARDWARIAAYVLDRLTAHSGDSCMDGFTKEATSPLSSTGARFWKPGYGYQFGVDGSGNAWMIGHQGKQIALHAPTQRAIISLGWRYNNEAVTELFNRWVAMP